MRYVVTLEYQYPDKPRIQVERKITATDMQTACKRILARAIKAPGVNEVGILDIRRDLSMDGFIWSKKLGIGEG